MYLSRRHLLLGLLSGAAVLAADRASADRRGRDHDAVRIAVDKGEIRPLADIIAALRGKLPGEIVGVDIERKEGRWVYEFRVVNGKGQLFDVYVDGRTAEIDRIREK
jgi:uncharacterized membrane protein YkoI